MSTLTEAQQKRLGELCKILPQKCRSRLGVSLSRHNFTVIAGGAVRRAIEDLPIENGDIDIFLCNQSFELAEICTIFHEDGWTLTQKKTKIAEFTKPCPHDDKKSYRAQLIAFHTEQKIVDSLLQTFDFSVCQMATNGRAFWCGTDTMNDLAARRLRVMNVRSKRSFLKRFQKYNMLGFLLDEGDIPDLAAKLHAAPVGKDQEEYEL